MGNIPVHCWQCHTTNKKSKSIKLITCDAHNDKIFPNYDTFCFSCVVKKYTPVHGWEFQFICAKCRPWGLQILEGNKLYKSAKSIHYSNGCFLCFNYNGKSGRQIMISKICQFTRLIPELSDITTSFLI